MPAFAPLERLEGGLLIKLAAADFVTLADVVGGTRLCVAVEPGVGVDEVGSDDKSAFW